jgi:hypothetical protein
MAAMNPRCAVQSAILILITVPRKDQRLCACIKVAAPSTRTNNTVMRFIASLL